MCIRDSYNIGDTLLISTIFSDSIEDLCTLNTFEIEGFPFQPVSQLYRFTDATTWDSGYRVNELRIDSLYGIIYSASNMLADQFRSTTIFENDAYHFQFEIIFKEPGRYIFTMTDVYEVTLRGGQGDPNAAANAITFDGKCPNLNYEVFPMVDSGDDHLDDFFGELEHLDSTTFRRTLGSIQEHRRSLNYTGSGVKAEFNAFYGFEVVE